MIPNHYLEWFFKDEWHVIGWTARTNKSKADLLQHARTLARSGGDYRIVPLPGMDDAAEGFVIHEWKDGVEVS